MRWLSRLFGTRTTRESHRWSDGSPRVKLTNDGMARLTLLKGLRPGAQPKDAKGKGR